MAASRGTEQKRIFDYASSTPGGNPGFKSSGNAWSVSNDVLALSSFPGTSVLRNRRRNQNGMGTCSCTGTESHRSFFDLCRVVIAPSIKKETPIPEVKVCWNSENLFECKLGRDLTGRGDRPEFSALHSIYEAQTVLYKGTYWFGRLIAGKADGAKHGRTGLAILRLLANLPTYSGKERIDQLVKMKVHKGSVNKLRSILATVDGLLMQLVLSFPDRSEFLTWERLDQVATCMIALLVPDYFRDKNADLDRTSTFEKVKRLRKQIKMVGFNPTGDLRHIDIPREMSFFEKAFEFISDRKRPIDIYRVSTLCQTRASGVPPESVYLKTLLKIKTLLQEKVDNEVYRKTAALIRPAVVSIHNKVLDRAGAMSTIEKFWKQCLDKAKISLSDSGEFFNNSNSGGKLEAARKVLSGQKTFDRINLYTGRVEGTLDPTKDPIGECLFHWACAQFLDRENCYKKNLMSVRIGLVAELGKYRAITVAHLAHAMLLHVLSHVLLEYLKGIPSSESGAGAANHAWNFFKRLSHKNPNANFLFDKTGEKYLFSTDWEQATDYCDHKVSQAILNNLCVVLGIPTWYRQTVMFALCAPRQVEFIDSKEKILEVFFTTRGELMGDPVVKPILHYFHLVARESSLMTIEALKKSSDSVFHNTPD